MSDSDLRDPQAQAQAGVVQNEKPGPEEGDPSIEKSDQIKKKKRSKTKIRKDRKSRKSKSKNAKGGNFRTLLFALLVLFFILYLIKEDEAGENKEESISETDHSDENSHQNQETQHHEAFNDNYQYVHDEAEMEEKYAKHFQHHCPVDWETPGSVLKFRGYSFFDNDDYYTGSLFCTSSKDLCDAAPVQSASCVRIDCEHQDAENAMKCSQSSIPYECKFSSNEGIIQNEGGNFAISPVGYKCKILNGNFCPPCQLSYSVQSTSMFGLSSIIRNTIALLLVATSVALCLKRGVSSGKNKSEVDADYYSDEDEYKYRHEDEDRSDDENYRKEMMRKKKLLKAKLKATALIKKMAKKEAAKRISNRAKNEASRSRKSSSRKSASRNSPSNRENTRSDHGRKQSSGVSAPSAASKSTNESFEMVPKKGESTLSSQQKIMKDSSRYSDESTSE
mmetsp:Transcript_8822/g.10058  ORF Transcript_8822/g.10058 Transcript_8822/m.10058 type:complete len:449 (+) Transcript_8822:9-1355(+)